MNQNVSISLDDFIVQGSGNIVSDMGGEKVMLSVQNGKYYNLGEMGGVIWDLIKEPITVTRLVDSLVSEYDVDRVICQGHVVAFLEQVWKEKLILMGDEVNR